MDDESPSTKAWGMSRVRLNLLVCVSLSVACGTVVVTEPPPDPPIVLVGPPVGRDASPSDSSSSSDAPSDTGTDARDAGDATVDASDGGVFPPASVVVGAPNRILLRGTVLTPSGPLVGEVLVEGDGTVRALPAGPVPGAAIRDAAVLAAMPEGSAVRAGRGIRCKTHTTDEWDMVMDSAEVLAEGRGVVFVLGGAETD